MLSEHCRVRLNLGRSSWISHDCCSSRDRGPGGETRFATLTLAGKDAAGASPSSRRIMFKGQGRSVRARKSLSKLPGQAPSLGSRIHQTRDHSHQG